MGAITCKFGGTSLADAACFRDVVKIIQSNPDRRFIVPSAPGRRKPDDKKITDLFYAWHSLLSQDLDPAQPMEIIASRFRELAAGLQLDFSIEEHLTQISAEAINHHEPDYLASRGEFLSVVHAAPVFALFGKSALGTTEMPPIGGAVHGDGAHYHLRPGKHNLTLVDWQHYWDFADRVFARQPAQKTQTR